MSMYHPKHRPKLQMYSQTVPLSPWCPVLQTISTRFKFPCSTLGNIPLSSWRQDWWPPPASSSNSWTNPQAYQQSHHLSPQTMLKIYVPFHPVHPNFFSAQSSTPSYFDCSHQFLEGRPWLNHSRNFWGSQQSRGRYCNYLPNWWYWPPNSIWGQSPSKCWDWVETTPQERPVSVLSGCKCTFAWHIQHQKHLDLVGGYEILQFLAVDQLLGLLGEVE